MISFSLFCKVLFLKVFFTSVCRFLEWIKFNVPLSGSSCYWKRIYFSICLCCTSVVAARFVKTIFDFKISCMPGELNGADDN